MINRVKKFINKCSQEKGDKPTAVFIQHSCRYLAGMEKGALNLIKFINTESMGIVFAAHKGDYWQEFRKVAPHIRLEDFPFYGNENVLIKFIRSFLFLRPLNPKRIILMFNRIDDFCFPEILASWILSGGNLYFSYHNYPSEKELSAKSDFWKAICFKWHKLSVRFRHVFVKRVTSISLDVTNALSALWGIPGSKITTCQRGVDRVNFCEDIGKREMIRREFGCLNGEILFLSVGRIAPEKRLDRLIGGFLLFLKDGWDGRLIIAGDGPLKDEYQQRVKQIPELREKVNFIGFRQDIDVLMKGADYLLLASDKEGQSNVIKEAMACGMIPIVTNAPGTKEISRDIIVSDRNVFDYHRHIMTAMKLSQDRIVEIKHKLIEEINKKFDLQTCAYNWLQVYDLPVKETVNLG